MVNLLFRRDALLAVLLVAVCASPALSQESTEVAQVRAELERLYELDIDAFLRRDVPALMELRAPDFHTVNAQGVVRDREAMQEYMQGIINGVTQWKQLTLVIDSLTVTGDTAAAIVWQFVDRMGLRPDNKVHHVQTWVTQRETWVRHGKRWLMWRVDGLRDQRRLVDGRPG